MASPYPRFTTVSQVYTTVPTQYTTGNFPNYPGTVIGSATLNADFNRAMTAEMTYYPARPQGVELTMPPQEGMWISERTPGSKPRKIIEVRCGSCIICEGRRHSIIGWQNLKRYIEIANPDTGKFMN